MHRTTHHPARRAGALAFGLLCTGLALPSLARAEALVYSIAVPGGEAVTYSLDFEVRHPGRISVVAEWSGSRKLSLRLLPPAGARGTVHRAGTSPQRVETEVADGSALGTWTLRVHALAAGGAGTGSVTIDLPEAGLRAARAPQEAPRPAVPPAGPVAEPETWMIARSIPGGAPARLRPFLEATERLRAAIAQGGPGPSDPCQWQAGLLGYLDARRDMLLGRGARPSESTAKLLVRIARAARSVEELRTSADPLVAGPAPRDARMRDAWIRLRTTRFEPVESELDRVLSMLHRGFAPELEDEAWPARYVSCLTACERFFEQRVRVGEADAHNRELAREQWPTLLKAADALAALAGITPEAVKDTTARR